MNKITDPAGREYQAEYDADGLLEKFIYPTGAEFTSAYNADGQLIAHADQEGGAREFTRTEKGTNWNVAVTTALERTTTYSVARIYDDGSYYVQGMEHQQRVITSPGDVATTITRTANGRTYTETPDGARYFDHEQTHKFWGALVAVPNVAEIDTPGGISRRTSYGYDLALRDADDPLGGLQSGESIVDTNQNGFIPDWTTATDYSNNSTPADETDDTYNVTFETPEGRLSHATLDYLGRTIESWVEGFGKTLVQYDSFGRMETVTQQGDVEDDNDDRVTEYEYYDAVGYIHNGMLQTITGPTGLSVIYEYDADGNATTQTLTNGEQLVFTYDASGRMTSVKTPGGHTHEYMFNDVWQLEEYHMPALESIDFSSTQTFNAERQLVRTERPDGTSITFVYDSVSARPIEMETPGGDYLFEYDSLERLTTGTAPLGRGSLVNAFDGPLRVAHSLIGNETSTGTIQFGFANNTFHLTSLQIKDETAIAYQYDEDGLLSSAQWSTANLALERNEDNGALTTATFSDVVTSRSFNVFGEIETEQATSGTRTLLANAYYYDKAGQISNIGRETISGGSTNFTSHTYHYDNAGRLNQVDVDGVLDTNYYYDVEGNRIKKTKSGQGDILYKHNAHNQLVESGDGTSSTTYTYDLLGRMTGKTDPDDTVTTYIWDHANQLTAVLSKDDQGTTQIDVQYLLDPLGRPVGWKVDGELEHRYLFDGMVSPRAEMNADGSVKRLFVYATRLNVPDFMVDVDSGERYRFVLDHLGSVRLVVNIDTKAVAQQLSYDEFGVVLSDTNPGFQPFGFAGGLYDPETGLTRFGARQYDASIGRWLRPDPIGFGGGLNLYVYNYNDPVNFIDPFGLGPEEYWMWSDPVFWDSFADEYRGWCGWVGMAPVVGEPFDFIDAGIAGVQGEWGDVAIAAGAMIPWGGNVVRGADKLNDTRKFVKHHTIPKGTQNKLPSKVRNHPDVRGRKGNPNRKNIPEDRHQEIHSSPPGDYYPGGDYNRRFDELIKEQGNFDKVSPEQINEIRDQVVYACPQKLDQ